MFPKTPLVLVQFCLVNLIEWMYVSALGVGAGTVVVGSFILSRLALLTSFFLLFRVSSLSALSRNIAKCASRSPAK